MKAILKFDLTDADDAMEFRAATKADSMAIVLWQITYNLRRNIENKIDMGEIKHPQEAINSVMEYINDELESHGIIIDDLTN